MSYSQMRGQSILIGSTIGEGVLKFSDGTKQYTAYPGTLTDGLTVDTLNVTQSATIGTTTTESTPSLTIYGTVQQKLTGDYCTQFGLSALTSNTGENNTAFGYGSMQSNSTGYSNASFGDYSLYSSTTGGQNVAIGHSSLQQSNGVSDVVHYQTIQLALIILH
jgi:hypothetical protein